MNGIENLPKSNVPIAGDEPPSQPWYRFISLLFAKPGTPEAVTVGASPFDATFGRDGFIIINGGTVSLVEYVRGSSSPSFGTTAGQFVVKRTDTIRITHTVAPVVTFFPD